MGSTLDLKNGKSREVGDCAELAGVQSFCALAENGSEVKLIIAIAKRIAKEFLELRLRTAFKD
jgi:hypothetical protein